MPIQRKTGWKGAWPEEVLSSFLALTGEHSIKNTDAQTARTVGGRTNYARERRERIAELYARVRDHDGYRRLKELGSLASVDAERLRLARSKEPFAEPFAEIRLAHEIAILVGMHDPRFVPRRATLTQQRKAHRATRVLRQLLMPGAQLDDLFEMSDLSKLLHRLEIRLDQSIKAAERSNQRPVRSDKDAAQRYWLIGFCKNLVERFGEAPPSIVRDVAAMVNYEPDEATIARYIKRASDQVRHRAGAATQAVAPAQISRNLTG